ncbi:MAG: hypothetical protein LBL50_00525 [Candidatus Margulisbacteria bacterium]|jgi:hypothetical protein|nr:hypothetical protein [Candidatus Margulisiibacteriota bacterium]
MRLFRKLIKFTEAEIEGKFAENEVKAYKKSIKDASEPVNKFVNRTGRNIFDLTLIYPLRDDRLAQQLLSLQDPLADILGDSTRQQGHFYSKANDLHMTLLHCAERSSLFSAEHRQSYRDKFLEFFFDRERLFVRPKIHFCGGSVGKDAVIIHGYNFTELNNSRLALARYGIQHKLFDKKLAREYSQKIFNTDLAFPNIAHLSLLRLGRVITTEERLQINELLAGLDFGETVFPELGLYEISEWGVFSSGRHWANLIFGRDPQ